MKNLYVISALAGLWMTSCEIVKDTPKYKFSNGYYVVNKIHQKQKMVYVDNHEDIIYVYSVKKGSYQKIDTSHNLRKLYPEKSDSVIRSKVFIQRSLDLDFITLPFKYRFSVRGFPNQINANINGAVYLGYRTDLYYLRYKPDATGISTRQKIHGGFSLGGFTGIGSSAINPWVTENRIGIEYDGVVWLKGVAGILAIDKYTLGIGLGWDSLLDSNSRFWIYQRKPWLGLAFGLNLN